MNRLGTSSLLKIASVGGVFVIGNAIVMQFLTQKRLKQSPYFIQARDILMANTALVNLLGEPVGFGSVDFANSNNFSTRDEAKFEIPLKGQHQEGMLYLWSLRNENNNKNDTDVSQNFNNNNNKYSGWNLKNLEVTIKDKPNQKLVLVHDSVIKQKKS
jgi:hypothetical protein